jgi:hypothetical protein
MKRYLIILAVMALFASSCSIAPEYSGTKYKRTDHVDVYYSFNDVKRDYTVIGHLVSRKYSDKIIQRNLISWAERVGADAIILTGTDITTEKVGAVVLKYKSKSL